QRFEESGQQQPVDAAIVDDEGQAVALTHGCALQPWSAATVGPQASWTSDRPDSTWSLRPSFAAASSARQTSESRSAPRLALLDFSVWAGRTTLATSAARQAASIAAICSPPSLTYVAIRSATKAS